ncbi:hypothetical protein ACHAXR_001777 [Thalassiosira sp. AJA248-18]
MEEASRRRISGAKNDLENPWRSSDLITIRGEESWMAVDHRLHLLQSSLAFSRIIGSAISYVNDDITHVQAKRSTVASTVAICQEIMKSGRHYAEFTVTQHGVITIGIIRPIHDWPNRKLNLKEYKTYCSELNGQGGYSGHVHQFNWNNDGFLNDGDVIGMILDLDEGTLTVYKNGIRLGVMIRSRGLAGHYCWAVTMKCYGSNRPSVRIKKTSMRDILMNMASNKI